MTKFITIITIVAIALFVGGCAGPGGGGGYQKTHRNTTYYPASEGGGIKQDEVKQTNVLSAGSIGDYKSNGTAVVQGNSTGAQQAAAKVAAQQLHQANASRYQNQYKSSGSSMLDEYDRLTGGGGYAPGIGPNGRRY